MSAIGRKASIHKCNRVEWKSWVHKHFAALRERHLPHKERSIVIIKREEKNWDRNVELSIRFIQRRTMWSGLLDYESAKNSLEDPTKKNDQRCQQKQFQHKCKIISSKTSCNYSSWAKDSKILLTIITEKRLMILMEGFLKSTIKHAFCDLQLGIFKACVCYFLLKFYFWPNDSPSKTMKNVLFHPKSSFRSRNIHIFVFSSSPLFFTVSHYCRGWSKKNLKVYDIINCLNKNLITHFVWYRKKEIRCDIDTLFFFWTQSL